MKTKSPLEADFQTIPLFELDDFHKAPAEFAQRLREACHHIGFFYLRSSSIRLQLMEEMLQATARFFNLPQPIKDEINISKSPHFRGYGKLNQEMTLGLPDFKETYDLGLEQPARPLLPGKAYLKLQGPNPWPDLKHQPDQNAEPLGDAWKSQILDYIQIMQKLGEQLMSALALGLGKSPDFFAEQFKADSQDSFAMLRLLKYPPSPPATNGATPTYGVGPHVDSGCLVILLQDEVGGLQVQNRKGEWIDVPPLPGTWVVNIGKMLQLWSNHYFLATPHRVLNSTSKVRHSVPFFFEPSLSTEVRPLDLPPELGRGMADSTCVAETAVSPVIYGEYMLKVFERSFPS